MIISREEKDNKVKATYKSSTIIESTYDKDTNNLTVVFKNGGNYQYANVKNTDYARFELAESQGKVLNSHIKQYPFTRLENVDTQPIFEKIEKVELEARQKVEKEMIDSLRTLVQDYDTNGGLNPILFKDAITSFNYYGTQLLTFEYKNEDKK